MRTLSVNDWVSHRRMMRLAIQFAQLSTQVLRIDIAGTTDHFARHVDLVSKFRAWRRSKMRRIEPHNGLVNPNREEFGIAGAAAARRVGCRRARDLNLDPVALVCSRNH